MSLGRIDSITGLLAHWSVHAADLPSVTTPADASRSIDSNSVGIGPLTSEAPVRPSRVFCTIGNHRRQAVTQQASTSEEELTS